METLKPLDAIANASYLLCASNSQLQSGTVEDMYLCICRAIRERDVDAAVRAGARRPVDVFRACGQNPQCGGCASDMRKRIDQTIGCEQAASPTLMAAD
jgi:bacterioferritin-associated ferredoxin